MGHLFYSKTMLALLGLCGIACSHQGGEANISHPTVEQPFVEAGKADRTTPVIQPQVERLGALQYKHLLKPTGAFMGPPLMVSNNPEHVSGYGLLASSSVTESQRARSNTAGAPPPTMLWSNEDLWTSQQMSCALGEASHMELYLAHILDPSMGADRRISIILEASEEGPADVEWSAFVGTTTWSDIRGYKTKRPDWLGAQVARARLGFSEDDHEFENQQTIAAGQRITINTTRAQSLVEGFARIKAREGCFSIQVIAHPREDALDYADEFAQGDVKWPGWYNGQGYGRAAGIFEGSRWTAQVETEIINPVSAFGWTMLDAASSPAALMRYADSSEILFGGYGLIYTLDATLANLTQDCVSVLASFTSYAHFKNSHPNYPTGGRTPSWATFWMNETSDFPTMLWNGPIRTEHDLRSGARHEASVDSVLTVDIQREEREDSYAVIDSLSEPLFRMELTPGEVRNTLFEFPVPGYIVAPVAIAFETQPCASN